MNAYRELWLGFILLTASVPAQADNEECEYTDLGGYMTKDLADQPNYGSRPKLGTENSNFAYAQLDLVKILPYLEAEDQCFLPMCIGLITCYSDNELSFKLATSAALNISKDKSSAANWCMDPVGLPEDAKWDAKKLRDIQASYDAAPDVKFNTTDKSQSKTSFAPNVGDGESVGTDCASANNEESSDKCKLICRNYCGIMYSTDFSAIKSHRNNCVKASEEVCTTAATPKPATPTPAAPAAPQ